MESVIVKARAKINLALDVLGTRSNGYHDLCMIMQTLRLHDSLLIKKTDKYPFKLVCDNEKLPVDERNLAYQAAQYLIQKYHIQQGVFISLLKRIPVSAGLAGGSSDCAAVLSGMNLLFGLGISQQQLMEIGIRFGADVPFCLMQGTALAEGIGEQLTRLPPHPNVWVLLARPSVSVSTKAVFSLYDSNSSGTHPDIPTLINALEQQDINKIAAGFGNVLTGVTTHMHPDIEKLVNLMRKYGALNAAMTGSGPTVFGYFEDKEIAVFAMNVLKQACPTTRDYFLTEIYNN